MLIKTNEKGASMIEVLAVMAVIGVIAMGLMKGIALMHEKVKITEENQLLHRIAKNAKALLPESNLSGSLSPKKLVQAGILDEGRVDMAKDKAYDAFGLEMSFSQGILYDSKTFMIYVQKVPKRLCIDLLTSDWGTRTSTGLLEVALSPTGGSPYTFLWPKEGQAETELSLPVSTAAAMKYCSQINDTKSFLAITFYL